MAKNDPIAVEKNITWQEQTQQWLEKAREDKDAEAVVYYLERLTETIPKASFELFKQSFAYKYWLEDNQSLIDNTAKAF
jgi:hypothetical protein